VETLRKEMSRRLENRPVGHSMATIGSGKGGERWQPLSDEGPKIYSTAVGNVPAFAFPLLAPAGALA
jgi:hypothetical protein